MSTFYELDIDNWVRKDHFHFFRKFEEPFFGLTVDVDCTLAYEFCKDTGKSFFLYHLYQSLRAANETEPFRYRIAGDAVRVYEQVNASPTINRTDGTFGFSYMDFCSDLDTFINHAKKEITRVQNSKGLVPAVTGENVIHYSSLPWIRFTSVSHARSFSYADSCPKISFGKMTDVAGKRSMPVSVHLHHALADGYHVGQFLDRFADLMHGTTH